jgi:hypothetical protein
MQQEARTVRVVRAFFHATLADNRELMNIRDHPLTQ